MNTPIDYYITKKDETLQNAIKQVNIYELNS
jgi:hypothetical protein